MPLQIKRTYDEVKLLSDDVGQIVKDFVERDTGRQVQGWVFHLSGKPGIDNLGAVTVRLEHRDQEVGDAKSALAVESDNLLARALAVMVEYRSINGVPYSTLDELQADIRKYLGRD